MLRLPQLRLPAICPELGQVVRQLLLAAPIRLWGLILAGPPLTLFAWGLVHSIRAGWPAGNEALQINILGNALYGCLLLIAFVIISLAGLKVDAETKLGKLSVDGDHDEVPPPPRPTDPPAV